MATKYTLTINHKGADMGNFCIYQTLDDQPEEIRSLAWFSKQAHPNTKLKFDWDCNYALAWSETGELKPGMTFKAADVKPINLAVEAKTASALSADGHKPCYKQTNQIVSAGEIGLLNDETVPEKCYSVGVQMSGATAFAAQAGPNFNYTFKPHPQYWVAFGKFEEGQVLSLDRMTGAMPLKLSEEVPNCAVTLEPDGFIK